MLPPASGRIPLLSTPPLSPELTRISLPAWRPMLPFCVWIKELPKRKMLSLPEFRAVAEVPANRLTLQFFPALIPEDSSKVILLPASSVSVQLVSSLSARRQTLLSSMLFAACNVICERLLENELTFKVSVSGESPALMTPDPGALSPEAARKIFCGSIRSLPSTKPEFAWPPIVELIAPIWLAEISTSPPLPPRDPPEILIEEPGASTNLLSDLIDTEPPELIPASPLASIVEFGPKVNESLATNSIVPLTLR